jgi:hypothetical protein
MIRPIAGASSTQKVFNYKNWPDFLHLIWKYNCIKWKYKILARKVFEAAGVFEDARLR